MVEKHLTNVKDEPTLLDTYFMHAKHDAEPLLPTDSMQIVHKRRSDEAKTSLFFKIYIIFSMTWLWTFYTLLVRHTRSTIDKENLYSPPTVVCISEFIKLGLSCLILLRENSFDVPKSISVIRHDILGKPMDLLKMSVPSIAYAIQNNLDFVALSNLNAAVYQVTTQLKVVSTALFMIAFLGRQFSPRRWIAILMLFVGVAAVQLNNIEESARTDSRENPFVGLMAVISTCVIAGFAGVYFERMLKDGSNTSLWVRNIQMYICGFASAGLGVLLKDSDHLKEKGFFWGYSQEVWAVVGFLSCGGIYISLVMKYLDNLHKSFASSVAIILVVILSIFFFDGITIGFYFIFGAFTVCLAILMYNSVNE